MKIGVDFDDIVFDFNEELAHFHNHHYGTSYCRADVQTWILEDIWGCTRQEATRRLQEWFKSQEHNDTRPVKGAQDAVKQLALHHELHIITARPSCTKGVTPAWLDRYFPEQFAGLHMTSHFEHSARSKADVCKELGISLLIDDGLVHARAVAATGTTVLLLDCPWNQEEAGKGIIRVYGWDDILSYIADSEIPVNNHAA